MNSNFGNKIKLLRTQKNMTQQELADKLGYKSRSTINKIELGKNDLHPTKIMAFADVLDTTPAFLLGIEQHSNYVLLVKDNFQQKYFVSEQQFNEIKKILEER